MRIILLLLLSFSLSWSFASDFVLVRDGKPAAVIAPPDNDSLLRIANLFNRYIKEITGTELEIKGRKGGYQITFNLVTPENLSHFPYLSSITDKEILKDAFYCGERWGLLTIAATTITGLENGVHSFMEKYAGVRVYAHDAIIIPKQHTFIIDSIEYFSAPAFTFRTPYYYEAGFKEYIDFHKLSSTPKDTNKLSWPVSDDWGLWVHTMHKLLPPEKWFNEHPEYYALRNDVRMTDQACLSNPDVLEIVSQNLKNEISSNPKAKYWSVSQMDNFNYCECHLCRTIDSIEGSPSGSVIRFTNEIARRFPDRVISTLAYQYTRKAPKVTKPLPNVNIMLCTIECDRSKPIASDTSSGSFYNDLKGWSVLTDNIVIWDYVINFSHLLVPFPNLHVLADNLLMFKENNVKMVFEQGLRGSSSGEMNELRTYILSKLLWDPQIDTDSLINDFVTGYYGKGAAPYIIEYLTLSESELYRSGKPLTLYEPPGTHNNGFLSPDNLKRYFSLLNQALTAANGDSVYTHRINMAMQPLRYAWLEVAKSVPFTDDWLFSAQFPHKLNTANQDILNDLTTIASLYGPILFHEIKLSPEEYKIMMTDYFNNGIVQHKALGKTITFAELPDPKYHAKSDLALVDGVKGTASYQMLWQGWWGKNCELVIDLGKEQLIEKVIVGYLEENQSWIMGPKSVEVFISVDGIDYNKAGETLNPKAGLQQEAHTSTLVTNLNPSGSARYLRLVVHNLGKLPSWRGIDADSWLFLDEVEIY